MTWRQVLLWTCFSLLILMLRLFCWLADAASCLWRSNDDDVDPCVDGSFVGHVFDELEYAGAGRCESGVCLNVVVPVRNEEKYLKRCLDSVRRLSLQPDKIVVYDDDSCDGSRRILESYRGFDNFLVVEGVRPPGDMAHRYGMALQQATRFIDGDCDFLGVLDADTVLEPDYYRKVVGRMMRDPGYGLCGGLLVGEDISPRFFGLPTFVYGANRVYDVGCWLDLNGGSMTLQETGFGVDTVHFLEAILKDYRPTLYRDVLSWSLRERPGENRLFHRGYVSWLLGYYGWYLFLRGVWNRSPGLIAGYLKASTVEAARWETEQHIQAFQLNRVRKALGLPIVSGDPKQMVRVMYPAVLRYQRLLKGNRIKKFMEA